MEKQSRTEKLLLAELYNLGLRPEPQYNISRMHVDFAFPDEKLVVEVNGVHHFTEEGKKRDRNRYFTLKNKGWKILNYRAEKVHKYPKFIAEKIKEELDKINGVYKKPEIDNNNSDKTESTIYSPSITRIPYRNILYGLFTFILFFFVLSYILPFYASLVISIIAGIISFFM